MFATTLTMTALLVLGLPAQDETHQADSHAGHSHDGSDPFDVFLDHTTPAICTVSFILDVRGRQKNRITSVRIIPLAGGADSKANNND